MTVTGSEASNAKTRAPNMDNGDPLRCGPGAASDLDVSVDVCDHHHGGDHPFALAQTPTLSLPAALLLALSMCLYNGGEVGFGGWLVDYVVDLDLAEQQAASYVVSAFWAGLTTGHLLSAALSRVLTIHRLLVMSSIAAAVPLVCVAAMPTSFPLLWAAAVRTIIVITVIARVTTHWHWQDLVCPATVLCASSRTVTEGESDLTVSVIPVTLTGVLRRVSRTSVSRDDGGRRGAGVHRVQSSDSTAGVCGKPGRDGDAVRDRPPVLGDAPVADLHVPAVCGGDAGRVSDLGVGHGMAEAARRGATCAGAASKGHSGL